MSQKQTWIVLVDTGGFKVLANGGPPHQDDIERTSDNLYAMGRGGWLAVIHGDMKDPDAQVEAVECLAASRVSWETAVEQFNEVRGVSRVPAMAM